MARRFPLPVSLLGVLLLTASAVPAHEGEKLGTVHFETSCSAAAQPAFDRAVAMLHSFWFQMALGAFDEVAKIDPTCGMAYWGQAMTWWGNPLSGPPVARGLTEGWAAVQRAKTPREMAYIGAVEAFYKDAVMRAAADLEDATEKHPVTPGAIKPACELLGEMLLAQRQPAAALAEFEASQKIDPNRLAALYGAARAAEGAGDAAKARRYYDRVAELGQKADADRPEVAAARAYLKK